MQHFKDKYEKVLKYAYATSNTVKFSDHTIIFLKKNKQKTKMKKATHNCHRFVKGHHIFGDGGAEM